MGTLGVRGRHRDGCGTGKQHLFLRGSQPTLKTHQEVVGQEGLEFGDRGLRSWSFSLACPGVVPFIPFLPFPEAKVGPCSFHSAQVSFTHSGGLKPQAISGPLRPTQLLVTFQPRAS